MKVKELIEKLEDYNPDAEMYVIAHNRLYKYTITFGGFDGCTKLNCNDVSLYVDELCMNERGI